MEMNIAMLLQEGLDFGGLVCGEVVQDDVDLLLGLAGVDHLAQKADEFVARMRAAVLPWTLPVRTSKAA